MTIKEGSKVSIDYTLTVEGRVIDTSEDSDPMVYTQGMGQIIPGLEKEIANMNKGEKKSVIVSPDDGYGPHNPDAIRKVDRNAFENAKELKVGGIISGEVGGQQFQAVIMAVSDTDVTIDLNHPLAGKILNFDIEIVEVEDVVTN